MTKKTILFIAIILLSRPGANAQFYLTGQDAIRTRWSQLSTTYFRLIFPESFEHQAQHAARLLEAVYPQVNAGLGARALRTDVVLHNQNSISNALVAWAPRRMDFFHVPPQDGYSQEWMRQLVLHELRHVAQMSRLETGFGSALRVILGQQATGAMAGLFLPNWFMEGDAVWTETLLSDAGRGRSQLFSAGLKAQLSDKGIYSYEKAWFGSYRDFTPDIYELGYHIVAYNNLQYGEKLWESAINLSAQQPWRIYPFSSSLRKQTGLGVGKLYKATMDSLRELWKPSPDNIETPNQRITRQHPTYTNYRYPQLTPYGIVAFRTSFDDLSRIVLIDSVGERVLFSPFYVFPEGFSARNDFVVWNEFQPDLRWSNKAFSVIKIGSITKGKVLQISHKSYFYAPDLDHSAQRIAVSEVRSDGSSAIVVLDAATGGRLFEYTSEKFFLHQPKWLTDDEHIAFLATGPEGKSIWLLNTRSMHAVQYTRFIDTDFRLSSAADGQVFLHGAWNDRQENYVFDFSTQQLKRLTLTPFGAADPVLYPDGKKMVYAHYTSDGWMLAAAEVDNRQIPVVNFVGDNKSSLLGFELQDKRFNIGKVVLPDTIYPVKPYRRGLGLFRLHSWAPAYVDAATQHIRPGLSLMSQNSLSTMVATAGFDYDLNERTGKTVLNMTYYGLFPVLDASLSNGYRKSNTQVNGIPYNLRWRETIAGLQVMVPLNFTRSRWQRGLNLSSGLHMIHRKMDEEVGLNFKQDFTTALSYGLLVYNLDRRKIRDIFPQTGQVLRLIYRHTPYDSEPGSQLFASAQAYFPGFAAHHGFRLYSAIQRGKPGFYNFGTYLSLPRGQVGFFDPDMEALKIDYVFPFAYPDHRVGPLVYTKRLRANLFYDMLSSRKNIYNSMGTEIWADVHLFRMPAPVAVGFRLSYNVPHGNAVPEFLFGIDWNSIY